MIVLYKLQQRSTRQNHQWKTTLKFQFQEQTKLYTFTDKKEHSEYISNNTEIRKVIIKQFSVIMTRSPMSLTQLVLLPQKHRIYHLKKMKIGHLSWIALISWSCYRSLHLQQLMVQGTYPVLFHTPQRAYFPGGVNITINLKLDLSLSN